MNKDIPQRRSWRHALSILILMVAVLPLVTVVGTAQTGYTWAFFTELKHGRLPELERQLLEAEVKLPGADEGTRLLREEVTENEIAEIVPTTMKIRLKRTRKIPSDSGPNRSSSGFPTCRRLR